MARDKEKVRKKRKRKDRSKRGEIQKRSKLKKKKQANLAPKRRQREYAHAPGAQEPMPAL